MRLQLTVAGIKRNQRRFERVGERVQDMRPVGDEILDEFVAAQERHWNALPWPPLARSTLEQKRRQGFPARRMHRTGLLERTLTTRGPEAQRRGQHARKTKTSVAFGIKRGRSDIFYGRFHQQGQGVPKRVVVPTPTKLTRVRIARRVLNYLVEGDRWH